MMHPRNIYNKPPNFSELRSQFPEFAAAVHIDIDGKIRLDFKNPESVRVLSKCCLKKDFDLSVELPAGKLLPTLPLRINYIHWIEDILAHCGIKEDIVGVDIGTGASCIYCLLSLRMNSSWKMFALEVDRDNLQSARDNVTRNGLDEQIILVDQQGSDKIFERLLSVDSGKKTFTICNPPFFSSSHELTVGENRSGRRKRPHSSYIEASSETVFYEGGELGFVKKILDESMQLKDQIEIYSSMFGCKKNLQNFISILRSYKVENFTTTELVQGKVFRWAVAWSYSNDIANFKDHTKSKDLKSDKKFSILSHTIENMEFKAVHDKLLCIFSDLKITTKLLKEEKDRYYNYELEAFENTWSNQRRRKRAGQRNEQTSSSSETAPKQNLLMAIEIRIVNAAAAIKLFYLGGSMPKDCANQILQYIKNNMK